MQQNNKIDFYNHRRVWNSKEFATELFGKEFFKDPSYHHFLDTIKQIPESENYTIAAYGSLMNYKDIGRTIKSYNNVRTSTLKGFRRIFNMGFPGKGCFLNIQEDPDSEINLVLFDVPFTELPEYILREGMYDVVRVNSDAEIPILTVIGCDFNETYGIEPQLNYVHLCISGIGDLEGAKGIEKFLDNTYCYSSYHGSEVKLKDWLLHLELKRYMIEYEYTKR